METSGFKLVIDTREQKPLEFKAGVFSEIVVEGRPVADYWCEIDGKEIPVCFERKGLGDLYGTMTHGYARWKKMISKADSMGMKVILLIEGTIRQVAEGYPHSQFSGDAMLKKLAMLRVRYDLEWHCFQDRREMARYIEEFYSAVKRNYEVIKEGESDA